MADRNAPCSERIEEHLKSRLEDADAFNKAIYWPRHSTPDVMRQLDIEVDSKEYDGDLEGFTEAVYESALERHSEYPLAIEVKKVVIVQLSTGGPGDWFEVWVDADGDVDRIVYHFNDWFDHAETELHDQQFDTAENFLRPYLELA